MTSVYCPACHRPVNEGARFCLRCGLEARQPCPGCGTGELFWLASTGAERAVWCSTRSVLLYACEACGRWQLPGADACADPGCGARLLPAYAQHTGRRWDGRDCSVGWTYPQQWDSDHPAHTAPSGWSYEAAQPVHAVLAAHGCLYTWEGTNLARLAAVPSESVGGPAATGAAWRSALGAAAKPAAGSDFTERAAIAGAACVLATEPGYLAVSLLTPGDLMRLDIGKPIAQVGNPRWWVAWSAGASGPGLYLSPVGYVWEALQPLRIECSPGAAPAPDARLVIRDNMAYWVGVDDTLWSLDCATGAVASVAPAQGSERWIWVEGDGPRVACEQRGRIVMALDRPHDGVFTEDIVSDMAGLRQVLSIGSLLCIAGDQIDVFDRAGGQRIGRMPRPRGRWVAGVIAPCADGEPRLLALTLDQGRAILFGIRTTGAQDELWSAEGCEPTGLLPIDGYLRVAHTKGIVSLTAEKNGAGA